MMDPKDSKLKDLAQDAGFAPGDLASAQRVLDALAVTPGLSIDPPPGYEARLLAQLSAKLPPVAAPAPRRAAAAPGGLRGWIPQFGWGLGGVLVASLVWSAATRSFGPASHGQADLLVATARKASPEMVASWLASIGAPTYGGDAYGEVVAAVDSRRLKDLSDEDWRRVEGALGAPKTRR